MGNVMKPYRMICWTLVFILGFTGCYKLVYKPQDMKNVRRQLHIPNDIRLVSFDSNPKEAGFFGREGLRISALFQFDDKQLSNYLNIIEDRATWQPVSFISYSPSRADEYSSNALRWFDLPIPSWANKQFKYWDHIQEVSKVKHGKYYGSVITAKQGERIDHSDGGYHYKWTYICMSFSEVTDQFNSVITTFAVLDMDLKKLYALTAFSG